MDRAALQAHSEDTGRAASRAGNARSMLLRQTLMYLPSQLAGPAMQFAFAILWTHWRTSKP